MSDPVLYELCMDCGRPIECVGGDLIMDRNIWIAMDTCDCGAASGTWVPKVPGLKE